MTNSYFTPTALARQTLARAEAVNSQFQAVEDGFDLLPSSTSFTEHRFSFAADIGVANAYVVTLTPEPSAYVVGMTIDLLPSAVNTDASTINANGLGNKQILTADGGPIAAGQIPAGRVTTLKYDGSAFRISALSTTVTPENGSVTVASLASSIYASLADAQGGAEDTKIMTSLRVKQAIEGLTISTINIDGGSIDGAVIGANSAAAATFTTITATGGSITGITDLAVADGGTGASTAGAARTNLGLVIGSDVQAYDATLQSVSALGTAADRIAYTTAVDTWAEAPISAFGRSLIDDAAASNARTTLGVVIGTDVQAYSTDLATIAGLAKTDGNVIVGNGTSWVVESGATARASLGVDAAGTDNSTDVTLAGTPDYITISGQTITRNQINLTTDVTGDLPIADGGTGSSTASGARTNLGLVIGSDVQAYDADLSTLAGLAKTNSNFIVGNGTAWVVESGATVRTSLGLGSLATASTINNGNWSGTDLSIENGGTGASDAGTARTNLGLAIGANVQAYDADLSALAGLAKTNGNFIVGNGSTWVIENGATARTSLGLGSLATLSNINNGNWSGTDLSVANGGTGRSTLTSGAVLIGNTTSAVTMVSMTTKGHLLAGDGSGAPRALSVGTNGYVLTADSSETTGLKWAEATGGTIVQVVNTETGSGATGTTTFPVDDTIPQSTEGSQFMTLAITPTSATNILEITVVFNCSHGTTGNLGVALFQDSTANALAMGVGRSQTGTGYMNVTFKHRMTAGTTSATTFKVRAGLNNAGTLTMNGTSGSRRGGGTMASSITIKEIAA